MSQQDKDWDDFLNWMETTNHEYTPSQSDNLFGGKPYIYEGTPESHAYAGFKGGKEKAHILTDILRELVELRHIKITQGKTPGYLERQPKAWARAEEAVK